jgi:hypothetical protein
MNFTSYTKILGNKAMRSSQDRIIGEAGKFRPETQCQGSQGRGSMFEEQDWSSTSRRTFEV